MARCKPISFLTITGNDTATYPNYFCFRLNFISGPKTLSTWSSFALTAPPNRPISLQLLLEVNQSWEIFLIALKNQNKLIFQSKMEKTTSLMRNAFYSRWVLTRCTKSKLPKMKQICTIFYWTNHNEINRQKFIFKFKILLHNWLGSQENTFERRKWNHFDIRKSFPLQSHREFTMDLVFVHERLRSVGTVVVPGETPSIDQGIPFGDQEVVKVRHFKSEKNLDS